MVFGECDKMGCLCVLFFCLYDVKVNGGGGGIYNIILSGR
jgi:hypothetical protein